MASEIISTTIDENFPVAGQDNDSQGFRDNFNIVKTALGIAGEEITELQAESVSKTTDNDFDNNSIVQANFRACTLESNTEMNGNPAQLEDRIIDWTAGPVVYIIKVGAKVNLTIANMPTAQYASMKFILYSDDVARTVEFFQEDSGTVKVEGGGEPTVIATSSTDPIVVEVFSYDNTVLFLRTIGSYS
jgi:hypothetical protein